MASTWVPVMVGEAAVQSEKGEEIPSCSGVIRPLLLCSLLQLFRKRDAPYTFTRQRVK